MNTLDILMAVVDGNRDLVENFLESRNHWTYDSSVSLDDLSDEVLEHLMKKTSSIIGINSNDMQSLIQTSAENGCVKVLNSLLHVAAVYDEVELASLLLDKGADIEAKCDVGILDWSDEHRGGMPLHTAVRYGSVEVAKLLLDRGANIEAHDDYEETPLHHAACDQPAAVELLIDRGAQINVRSTSGQTPLHHAAQQCGDKYLVEMLLNHGADMEIKNSLGETPLHSAARNSIREIAKVLLDHGANPYELNNEGKNLFELAMPEIINNNPTDVPGEEMEDLDIIHLFCHYKDLLDLNKPLIYNTLKEQMNPLIREELQQSNNNLDGLRNILEVFSNKGDKDFCENFLTKVRNHVQSSDFIPKLDIDLSKKISLEKFLSILSIKSKLEDLKKLFSSIESGQTDPYLESLSSIAADAYEKVNQSWERVDNHIINLGDRVIEPTCSLGKIAKTEASKNMFGFLDTIDGTSLFLTRDHRKTDALMKKTLKLQKMVVLFEKIQKAFAFERLADDNIEKAAKKLKVDEGIKGEPKGEALYASDHLTTAVPDISLSTIGAGMMEECKGQD